MTGPEATLAVIDALEELGILYMLVGSLSSSFYGIPLLRILGSDPRSAVALSTWHVGMRCM
jgi:hypothetical protein